LYCTKFNVNGPFICDIGLAADDPSASQPDPWRGLNLLGFALMAVRSEMQLGCHRTAQPGPQGLPLRRAAAN
jgi:hypothetical protein